MRERERRRGREERGRKGERQRGREAEVSGNYKRKKNNKSLIR